MYCYAPIRKMVNYDNCGLQPTNLQRLRKSEFRQWLNSFDVVLSDCDGVLWLGNQVLKGSPDIINFFKRIGKQVFFITNNSEKTRSEFLVKAHRMNYKVDADSILSSAYLLGQYLKEKNFKKTAYIIGTRGIQKELEFVGIKSVGVGRDVLKSNVHDLVSEEFKPDNAVGAVVVGYDEHFSIPKLTKASTYLDDPDVLFLASNADEREPSSHVVPGPGPIIASIENCTGRTATVVGKPNPYICDYIVNRCRVDPGRTLMIGDRCNTDILFGKNCGFQTLMVESGIHSYEDLVEFMESEDEETQRLVPDFYVRSLGALKSFTDDFQQ